MITSHLYAEADVHGRIRIFDFWSRRIRRLLPAAFLVLLVSGILAALFMPKSSQIQQFTEIGFASIYILNWPLATNSVDYLASNNSASIAQQYWSLAVEEQFYFFWPLLLLLGIVISRIAKKNLKAQIALLIVLAFIFSFAFSIYQTHISSPSAYFMTTTRVWEFAAGGILVFIPGIIFKNQLIYRAVILFSVVFLVLLSVYFLNSETAFPGWIALLPVLASAIIIWGGKENTTNTKINRNLQPLTFLGNISYELYLWHWPIIFIVAYLTGKDLGYKAAAFVLVLAVVLSYATKKFVDDPIRNWNYLIQRRNLTFLFAFIFSITLAISCFTLVNAMNSNAQISSTEISKISNDQKGCDGAYAILNDCPLPYAVTNNVNPVFAKSDSMYATGVTSDSICSVDTQSYPQTFDCKLNQPINPKQNIVLFGDSHSYVLAAPLKIASQKNSWYAESWSATAGCEPFKLMGVSPDRCTEWAENRLKRMLDDDSITTVIFASYYNTDTGVAKEWMEKLQDAGKKVVAIRSVPGLYLPNSEATHNNFAPDCVELNSSEYDPCSWNPENQKPNFPQGVTVIDTWEVLCPDGSCHTVIGGMIVYFDSNHMTTSFAKTLSTLIEKPLLSFDLNSAKQ